MFFTKPKKCSQTKPLKKKMLAAFSALVDCPEDGKYVRRNESSVLRVKMGIRMRNARAGSVLIYEPARFKGGYQVAPGVKIVVGDDSITTFTFVQAAPRKGRATAASASSASASASAHKTLTGWIVTSLEDLPEETLSQTLAWMSLCFDFEAQQFAHCVPLAKLVQETEKVI
jgi:hypothetical protein